MTRPVVVYVFQTSDYWITVHSLKSLDGGILDQDDRIADVVDDREQVYKFKSEFNSNLSCSGR
jgi:N-terminal of Par3 and HAL proteins